MVSVFSVDANRLTLVTLDTDPFFLPILVILGLESSIFVILIDLDVFEEFPAASVAVRVKKSLTVP